MTKMPWNFRDYFYLGLLMCCVPLQFYLSNYNRLTSNKEVFEIVNNIRTIKERWFSLQSWENAWLQFLSWFVTNILGIEDSNTAESPAIEVLEYRKQHGIQVSKDSQDDTRNPELWFHVGDVVEHLNEGYKAVIIEWSIDPEKSSQPLYKLLVDEDPEEPLSHVDIVEVEQDLLTLLEDTMITNRFIKNYFIAFYGDKYIPQPWLQELFPDDFPDDFPDY